MWKYNKKVQLVNIDASYSLFLNNIDYRVACEHVTSNQRPFVGILISSNNNKFVLPLSSPKAKHLKMKNTIDFHKIAGGKLGAINLNNMFPVVKNSYTILNPSTIPTNTKEELQYKNLLEKQLTWLNIDMNAMTLIKKAETLYCKYCDNTLNENVKSRCCNFPLLEEKCMKWKKTKADIKCG